MIFISSLSQRNILSSQLLLDQSSLTFPVPIRAVHIIRLTLRLLDRATARAHQSISIKNINNSSITKLDAQQKCEPLRTSQETLPLVHWFVSILGSVVARLRVIPLSLSPLSETVNKLRGNNGRVKS